MKKYITVLILILLGLPAVGQKSISFQTDFAYVSKINYQGADITEKSNITTHFGFNYTHFIKPKFAIETGLGLSNYSNKIMLPNTYSATTYEVDSFGSGFEFRVASNNYEEAHKILLATIPLRLRFEGPLTSNGLIFYASGGVKLMLPVSQKVNASANSITTTGYYPNNDLLIENVPAHGFITQNNVKTTINDPYKSSFALTAELGVKLRVENYGFYAGGFLDYSITDIRKDINTNNSVIAYVDADAPTKSNGVSTLTGIDKANLISFGLQLRFPLCQLK